MNADNDMNQHEPLYYLRDDAYFEPLLHKWYVWPYLLPPVTAAMNLTGRNLRLMKSFVANAQLHIAASQNRGLAGGDFVNCSADQIDDVRRLIEELEQDNRDYFDLRQGVTALNALLETQTGMSMEQLYGQVPDVLRGYVELVYDMNHHASFRLIEGLLYAGPLYKRAGQSVSFGLLSRVEQRPFVLSSPRLPDGNHLHADVRLDDPWLDRVFALRTVPASQATLDALFAQQRLTGGLDYQSLFTTTPPSRVHAAPRDGVRVTYVGHAGLLVETADVAVLVDPVIASRDGKHDDAIVSYSELPAFIDYVCITHTHMDHTCIETLLQLRHKIGTVLVPKNSGGNLVDPSIKLMLQALGLPVRELEDMERIACAGGHILAVPFLGEHADLNIRSKTAWYFELHGRRIFAGADAASLDERLYQRIHAITGDLDMLFIGMECVGAPMSWLYGALFTKPVPRAVNESRRFNGSDFALASRLVDIFRPRHVGIYALGMEPWFRYFMGVDYDDDARQIVESDQLLRFCGERDVPAERLAAKRVWNLEPKS